MKKILLFTFLSFTCMTSKLKAQSFEWAKQFSGTQYDIGVKVETDEYGNVYTVGQFQGTTDFDPSTGVFNLTAPGVNKTDVFISKIDANGDFLWAVNLGSNQNEFVVSSTIDKDNNIICSGIFDGTVDFDPGPGTYNMTSTSSGESFILKLDSAGNFLWATQRTGYSGIDRNYGLKTDSSGNIYTTGPFLGTSDFDPSLGVQNLTALGVYDTFIQKFDSNGNLIWVKQMGGTGADMVSYGMDIDNDGNVAITGYFTDTIDFDASSSVSNFIAPVVGAAFIIKYDNLGNYYWGKTFYGTDECFGHDIVFDENNNLICTGEFKGTIDFDPSTATYNLSSVGSYNNGYILKLNEFGNYSWVGAIGGTSGEIHNPLVAVDKNNDIYVASAFSNGTVDFDPSSATYTISPFGSFDGFIAKYKTNGSFSYARQIGGTSWDNVNGIHIDKNGNIYATGTFENVADFDYDSPTFNLTSTGLYDAYVVKYSTCFIANGITLAGSTLSLNGLDGGVQWVDCDNNYAAVSGANGHTFTPSVSGNYAAIVSFQSCVDTSECYSVTISSVNDINENLKISIYPNPTIDIINIDTKEEVQKIYIYNTLGSLVKTEVKTNFSVENLTSGIYLLHIETKNGTSIQRFVKD